MNTIRNEVRNAMKGGKFVTVVLVCLITIIQLWRGCSQKKPQKTTRFKGLLGVPRDCSASAFKRFVHDCQQLCYMLRHKQVNSSY